MLWCSFIFSQSQELSVQQFDILTWNNRETTKDNKAGGDMKIWMIISVKKAHLVVTFFFLHMPSTSSIYRVSLDQFCGALLSFNQLLITSQGIPRHFNWRLSQRLQVLLSSDEHLTDTFFSHLFETFHHFLCTVITQFPSLMISPSLNHYLYIQLIDLHMGLSTHMLDGAVWRGEVKVEM